MISGAFGSGLLAGLLSSLIFHPIDVIKIRSQVDEASFSKRQTLYQRVRMVYGDAGIRGFYRGLAPACLASSVAWGFYFLFYEPLKTNLADWNQNLVLEGVVVDDSFQTQSQHTQRFTNATVHFTASTFAGGLTVLLTNPIWVIKTRMELQQSNAEHYRGTIDAFRQIRHQEGIAGLYRGILPALILTSNGAIQFMIYEDLKARLEVFHEGTPSWAEIFAVGVVSKVVATTVTYPYQVAKARIQQRQGIVSLESEQQLRYRSIFQTFHRILTYEGLYGLYKGLAANLLRVAPHSALTLCVYEYAKRSKA